MGGLGRKGWRIGPWQRRLLIGLAVALTSQLYLTVWAEGFRVSTAAILYPALLVTMMRESHRPDTVRGDDAAGTGPGGRDAAGGGAADGVSWRRVLPLL